MCTLLSLHYLLVRRGQGEGPSPPWSYLRPLFFSEGWLDMPKFVVDMPKKRVFYLVSSISTQRQIQIASIFGDLKSTLQYLHGDIGFKCVGGGWCTSNFERDIVDTSWHASRKMGSTRPNRPQFLLYEGKV